MAPRIARIPNLLRRCTSIGVSRTCSSAANVINAFRAPPGLASLAAAAATRAFSAASIPSKRAFAIRWDKCGPSGGDLACQRTFSASARAGQKGPGPINAKAQAVPFSISREVARQKFDAFHNSGLFNTSRFANLERIDPVFIPFWVGSAEVTVRVVGGEVGFERMEPVYDFRSRRWTTQRTTHWSSIDREFEWDRRYDPSDASARYLFQPATFDYPRRYLSHLVTADLITQAVPFRPELVDDRDPENPRGARSILPFETTPNVVVDIIEGLITDREKYEAENIIKKHYNADNVRLLQVRVQFTMFRLTPFYLPTYIFTTSYLSSQFHTFVAATPNGPVSGQHYYSWERVALASAAAGGLYAFLAGVHNVFSATSVFWFFFVLPAFVGAFASRWFPLAYQYLQSTWQNFERTRFKARERIRGTQWDDERMGGYRREREEDAQRRRSQSYDTGRASRHSGDVKDPRSYYKALGVNPGATKEEIQAAFRGLAMKDHPDRYSDPREKEAAKVRFQKLSEAYTVLRDPRKRREYDLYGKA